MQPLGDYLVILPGPTLPNQSTNQSSLAMNTSQPNSTKSTANSIKLSRSDIQTEYHLELTPSGEVMLTVRQAVYCLTFATAIRVTHNLARCGCKVVSFD